jgi:arylsulfatase A-like enzyme
VNRIAGFAALLGVLVAGCGPTRDPALSGLLLLTVDTLRADRLGAYGSERGLTPHLDALAREALVFEAAYAPAPFTFPSLAGLFTGRYPGELGIRSNRSAIPQDVPTLASALRERGWRTGAVVSNFVLRAKTGLADGFDVYDDTMLQTELVRDLPERTARFTTDAALDVATQVAGTGAPWLLWVHYQDPHGPYNPPPDMREPLLADAQAAPDGDRLLTEIVNSGLGGIPGYQLVDDRRDVAFYRAGYDAEVGYTDREIGRLLEGLEARGVLDRAGLIFAADHGEALGEHDYWFAHGHQLTDELVRVPLLVRLPGLAPGRRSDVVSLVDVFPTLLARILQDAYPDFGSGRDLLAEGAEHGASVPFMATLVANRLPRYGIVDGDYKLILTLWQGAWRSQLFRRGHEDVDLTPAAPQVVHRLRQRLDGLRQRFYTGTPERLQELTAEEDAALRALGYIEAKP